MEAAVALARPDGGVVALVVPLSIAFGQKQEGLRELIEEQCSAVEVRHYDNIPDTMFNQHPLFKAWKNRQRSTVITAVRGDGPATIRTGPLVRWRLSDREQVLTRRPRLLLEGGSKGFPHRQWPRIPNEAVGALFQAVMRQGVAIGELSKRAEATASAPSLSLPKTGGHFVSVLPRGVRNPDREVILHIPDEDTRLLAIVALNGHVAFGWWRAFGDGFDVKLSDYRAFTIPDSWRSSEHKRALDFAHRLLDAVSTSRKDRQYAGRHWENVDFLEHEAELTP